MTTRAGSSNPFQTAFQYPSGVSPPPVTTQWICGGSTSVCPQVWRAATMPGGAPRYVGAPSNSPRVSRTACNKKEVIAGTWLR